MSQMSQPEKQTGFHSISYEITAEKLQTSVDTGLSSEEAASRLATYGHNILQEGKKKSLLIMFYEQFKSVMIIILLAAAAISAALGEYTDTAIIALVVVLNAVLGVLQENKAEKALEALKKMSSPYARVLRGGEVSSIKSEDIVPGDVILMEAGDFVPADIRLTESASLKIEEAALTGESVPSEKDALAVTEDKSVVGDRINMAFLSSSVTYGRGRGIAIATGMDTEVGKIAGMLSKSEAEETPLQKKLAELGKYLSIIVVAVSVIIFITGVLQKRDYFEMFLTAVSLSVAAIPEGLPAIVTIVLALGVQKMAKRNAIIRKLPAVETLGSTEIICSDKTGTLTQNKMTVKEIYINDTVFKGTLVDREMPALDIFMQVMALCNDSRLPAAGTDAENSAPGALGDPTEVALVNYAFKNGYNKNELEKSYPRKNEIPFDSARKLMTTVNLVGSSIRIMTKGAPDMLVERCTHISIDGKTLPFDDTFKEKAAAANSEMGSKALRVLAMAYRDLDASGSEKLQEASLTSEETETDLVFLGLAGMMDPPRYEVKDAVRVCREAGMRPVMITGDHRDTAAAIARELRISEKDSEII
ncbi:MAG: HAD-IC family P-type ATPase, partial [Eubacteriales bacterium]|nr:HAD-IC family P-type ATPase [Eubacteriales bacterium]